MAGPDAYSVSTPSGVCAVTGEPIPVGDRCISILSDPYVGDGLVRLDVRLDVWEAGRRPSLPGPVVGFWRTVIPDKQSPRRVLIGDDEVLDLFEQLGEADDPRQLAFRYLLCLILIRKRRLLWEGTVPPSPGRPGLIRVRRPREKLAEPIDVTDPGMDDDAIAEATRQLSMVMNLDEQETT